MRPEEVAQGIVELVLGFEIGKVANAVDLSGVRTNF